MCKIIFCAKLLLCNLVHFYPFSIFLFIRFENSLLSTQTIVKSLHRVKNDTIKSPASSSKLQPTNPNSFICPGRDSKMTFKPL